MDSRQQALQTWLVKVLQKENFTLTPASSDASFRRYFRIHFIINPSHENDSESSQEGGIKEMTLIAMDAPPPQEDCRPFVKVAQQLLAAGLNVPQIIAQDVEQGFLVLGDLGSDTYLSKLNLKTAPNLYKDATNALIKMQFASQPNVLPEYDEVLLTREMQLFPDWYIAKHLGVSLNEVQQKTLNKTFAVLNQNILAQPKVVVHRDYHSRNLMVTEVNNPGILDFQDAVYGPITYDLVSLLKDAYIAWEEEEIIDWAVRYWQTAKKAGLPMPDDFSEFYRDFEWMGAQRHIKVLGIFARLYYRDGKDGYLKDMPLVMNYLRKVCERYVELRPMLRLLNELESPKSA